MISKSNAPDGKKRSLILAGGGMRLAYQAGTLMALEEAGMNFQHVDATSGGIFNAAMLASGLKPREIAYRWRSLNMKDFVSTRPWKKYLRPLHMEGYMDADNIRDKVFKHLGISIARIRSNDEGTYTFNVCNFAEKSVESIRQDSIEMEHLLAGVSLPMVMPAQKLGETYYTDAVWIKDANLLSATDQGSDEIWLVWAIGNNKDYLPGALNQYVHMIEMSANGGLLEEYRHINHLVKTGSIQEPKFQVIKPTFPLPLDPDLFFGKIDARSLINMGYADAKEMLLKMDPNGVTMDANASKMQFPGDRFNTTMEFEGTIPWSQSSALVTLHLFLRVLAFREGSMKLEFFGSIFFGESGEELCLYNSSLTQGSDSLLGQASVLDNGQEYRLEWEAKIPPSYDILLGLGFKEIMLKVYPEGGSLENMEASTLYQKIGPRIKGIFTTNLRTAKGTPGSIIAKHRLWSKVLSHEI